MTKTIPLDYLEDRVKEILRRRLTLVELEYVLNGELDLGEDSLIGFMQQTNEKRFNQIVKMVLEEKRRGISLSSMSAKGHDYIKKIHRYYLNVRRK